MSKPDNHEPNAHSAFDYSAAVITVSDKGSRGERADTSGPAIRGMLEGEGWQVKRSAIVSDEPEEIKKELIACADGLGVDLILTTGGTGFSRRDNTPEATEAVIDRAVPGIPEAMRAESMRVTPMGMLSRATAGLRGNCLIINLPGSEKAAGECLAAVLPVLKHAIKMIQGGGH